MENTLLAAVHRFASIHTDAVGIARTPIPGLTIVRELVPTALQFAINSPMVALVLQGNKRVMQGSDTYDFGAGDSLLITADVPTVSQVTRANAAEPYYSLIVDLNPSVIATLVDEIGSSPFVAGQPVRVDPTDAEVADVALRLMRLINRPASLSVLQNQLVRELHFWLLSGRHGGAIRALGVSDSHVQRIRRAVAIIRERHADVLPVEQLAKAAGMGTSSFHDHFRAVTSLTPLQFQKQFRLIEARRMLMAEGAAISNAAYAVGYESIPQFTREYGRLFGQSPARDLRSARSQARSA
ncbi:AraC family transcriptional regulator [Devosia alba]|uniref:AraC family transcriptional regulator n=1 Tax=Devosia alba TaxID=3152360 RepID=UPI0032657311